MSLYSNHFDLLPRPARSIFSIGSESTRATIPDFETVSQLARFTDHVTGWYCEMSSLFTHCRVITGLLAVLIAIDIAVIVRRTYQRTFWIIRIIKRPEGDILVPNSILVFAVVEGIFGIIFLAYIWFCIAVSDYRTIAPTGAFLWLTLPWCALVFGAVWAAWGTFFATPTSLQSITDWSKKGCFQRVIFRPCVINWAVLLVPTAIATSVVIPGAIANSYSNRAYQLQKEWQHTYANQTVFTQAMVQDTQRVWFTFLKATRMASVAHMIWLIIAALAAISVTAVSWGLISALRKELHRDRNEYRSADSSRIEIRSSQAHTFLAAVEEGEEEEEEEEAKTPSVQCDVVENHSPTSIANEQDLASSVPCHHADPCTTTVPQAPVKEKKAGIFGQAMAVGTNSIPVKSQREYLQAALNHTYIQIFATLPACICFAGLALFVAFTIHSKNEQPSSSGGVQFEHIYGPLMITVSWTVVIAGAVTVLAIAHRTYEPVLSSHLWKRQRSRKNNKVPSASHLGSAQDMAQMKSSFFETRTRNTLIMQSLVGSASLHQDDEVRHDSWLTFENRRGRVLKS
ncbi:hypothetical protein CBS101457_002386 [Exobasidium rhododendri]|nr:hypothetical protein CBS101457_002386 [Exobasidium rhododendri]